ncbi:MAG: rRNA methyltransferase [Bacteroidetes bacterium 4484_249]|nr:MAG: rRNA methyltransferase [Bacteroidetes bacterium 4484_249]
MKLLNHLLEFVSENKKNLFENIIQYRTRYITVVLEDIFQPHNASAILRTCDCFGVQDVHIIENRNEYEVNPDVALGSSKWLNLIKYNSHEQNTLQAYDELRKKGYRIVATSPHKNDCTLEKLNLNSKVALIFGTELNGLSDVAINNADEYVKIPMYGFTESFNISVSASIILHYLTEKLRKSNIKWNLSEEEIIDVKLNWVKNVIKKSELIENKFLKKL